MEVTVEEEEETVVVAAAARHLEVGEAEQRRPRILPMVHRRPKRQQRHLVAVVWVLAAAREPVGLTHTGGAPEGQRLVVRAAQQSQHAVERWLDRRRRPQQRAQPLEQDGRLCAEEELLSLQQARGGELDEDGAPPRQPERAARRARRGGGVGGAALVEGVVVPLLRDRHRTLGEVRLREREPAAGGAG